MAALHDRGLSGILADEMVRVWRWRLCDRPACNQSDASDALSSA